MLSVLLSMFILCVLCAIASSNITSTSLDRTDRIAARVNSLLPQTQCQQCGFDGCEPYARAIARRAADVNRCPPGELDTANAVAELVGADRVEKIAAPREIPNASSRVVIDAERCIGCTKCLPPCPVDAIVGAQKQLHVVVDDLCTGCGLCIAPCPVDCISFVRLSDEP